MYNQTYDEYIRSILGYSNADLYANTNYSSDDLEHMYPEVYRVVYPIVCSACDRIQFSNSPITEDMVANMTDDIYDRVAADGRINIEINIASDTRGESESDNRQMPNVTNQRIRPRNRFLRDLIRILLLQELFRRRRRIPGRPPFQMRTF